MYVIWTFIHRKNEITTSNVDGVNANVNLTETAQDSLNADADYDPHKHRNVPNPTS